ncbi:c-type cytochrome [Sulfurimonas sp. HSL3-7]|uniref:c-type cytochrome n=1 Tax=Sulfonitrofixus jiaomeiensis TaxID=3131938 RepID=UPI0031F80A6A
MRTLLLIMGITTLLGAADGAALFKKCTSCHGAAGEKHALNKSRIINEMSKEEIAAALKGYKAGTYGGAMKALMKGQIAAYSDEQIDTVAAFIAAKKQ